MTDRVSNTDSSELISRVYFHIYGLGETVKDIKTLVFIIGHGSPSCKKGVSAEPVKRNALSHDMHAMQMR